MIVPQSDFAAEYNFGCRAIGKALFALTFLLGVSAICCGAAAQLRRPVALAPSRSPTFLLSANRDAGSISVIDVEAMRVVDEVTIGQRLSALAAVPQTNLLIATDEATHEVILFSCDDFIVQTRFRLGVGHTPVDVRVTADGSRCFVSSLWARQVTSLDIDRTKPKLTLAAALSLPFAPRKLLLTRDGSRLIVADSFDGQLAVVNPSHLSLKSVTRFPGCNIRGLAQSLDGDRLFVSHQKINPMAHTTKDDLRWGLLVTNHVRMLDMEAIAADEGRSQSGMARRVRPIGSLRRFWTRGR